MRAIILAGGKGTRLRPYTAVLPKPLMPLGDRPILDLVIRQLKQKAGVTRVTMAVGYLAPLLQAYFGDGERWGVQIDYSLEEKPLGTAGPLTLVQPPPDEDFLVMNGDILTDLDFGAFIEAHRASDAAATVATFAKPVFIDLGVLELDEQKRVTKYIEKPTLHYTVSTGMYVMSPQVLRHLEPGERCDLPDLMRTLVANGEGVHTYPIDGVWLDIGRPADYELASEMYEKGSFL